MDNTAEFDSGSLSEATREEPHVSVAEIKALITPSGFCEAIDRFRPRQSLLKEAVILPEVKSQELAEQITADIEKKTATPLAMIGEAFANQALLRLVIQKEAGEPLLPEEIREHLDISNYPLSERLAFIFNSCLDPEILPEIFQLVGVERQGMTPSLVGAFRRSEGLRWRWITLIADRDFQEEFYNAHPDQADYSAAVQAKISGVINTTVLELARDSLVTRAEITQARAQLADFFNLDKKFWPQEGMTASKFIESFSRITAETYFEQGQVWIDNENKRQITWVSGLSAPIAYPPREHLRDYALAVEKGRYMVELFQRGTLLIHRFIPELAIPDLPVQSLELSAAPEILANVVPSNRPESQVCGEANGYYRRQDKTVGIQSATAIAAATVEEIGQEETPYFTNEFGAQNDGQRELRVKRGIADMVTMLHELGHGIYEGLVRSRRPADLPAVENYHQTADHAATEGLAVLLELIGIDIMKEVPQLFGLKRSDRDALEACKQARLYRLKKDKNGYTEGTYRILHRVYAEAAGKGKGREVHRGLRAVREFLEKINPAQTLQVLRGDKTYRRLLREGSPAGWQALFGASPSEG
jgi:hypothetical protein